MSLSAALESFLEERQNLKLSQTNKILKMLRDAYSEGLPGLMARPQMDHLTQTGAFEFLSQVHLMADSRTGSSAGKNLSPMIQVRCRHRINLLMLKF